MNDAAYIQLEMLNVPAGKLLLRLGEEERQLEANASLEAQTVIALLLKTALEERLAIRLTDDKGSTQSLFEDEKERSNFLIVMQDYLRLTENSR